MVKKKHVLGNIVLKFEEDDLSDFNPIRNDKGEIIGWIEKSKKKIKKVF